MGSQFQNTGHDRNQLKSKVESHKSQYFVTCDFRLVTPNVEINMTTTQTQQLKWEDNALIKFDHMITRIPMFHRDIAKIVVVKKAEQNAAQRGSILVEEADIVKAFFSEVPKAFYSLMVRLMDEAKFDYKNYESKR